MITLTIIIQKTAIGATAATIQRRESGGVHADEEIVARRTVRAMSGELAAMAQEAGAPSEFVTGENVNAEVLDMMRRAGCEPLAQRCGYQIGGSRCALVAGHAGSHELLGPPPRRESPSGGTSTPAGEKEAAAPSLEAVKPRLIGHLTGDGRFVPRIDSGVCVCKTCKRTFYDHEAKAGASGEDDICPHCGSQYNAPPPSRQFDPCEVPECVRVKGHHGPHSRYLPGE